MPIKITQTVSEPAAELAYQRIAAVIGCPPSRILERLLLSQPVDDLLAQVQGRLSAQASKTIALDAESLLAIRSAVADSIPLFGGRVEDAARVGARQGAREAIDSTLDRDI